MQRYELRGERERRRWPANDNVDFIKRIVIHTKSGLLHVQAIEYLDEF